MLIDNKKRDFRMKALQDLTFSDDLMFGAVMRDEKICKGGGNRAASENQNRTY